MNLCHFVKTVTFTKQSDRKKRDSNTWRKSIERRGYSSYVGNQTINNELCWVQYGTHFHLIYQESMTFPSWDEKDFLKTDCRLVGNSWQTTMHLLKVFISRLMDDAERWRGSAPHPILHFYCCHRKTHFSTLLHLLVYTASALLRLQKHFCS